MPDLGQTENAFNLNKNELACRTIDYIDIVNDSININEYKSEEDPSIFQSIQTKRGPLGNNWLEDLKANSDKFTLNMCVYKLCRIECAFWGCQSRVEKLISESVLRHTILITHRQAWCWQDEYTHLTIDDVRRLEAETQRYLSMKMKNEENTDIYANDLNTITNNSAVDEPLSISTNDNAKATQLELKSSKTNLSNYSSSTTITAFSNNAKNSPHSGKRCEFFFYLNEF